jgi:parallel beta-helix repeat protein
MLLKKSIILVTSIIIICISLDTAQGKKSVFIISKHDESHVQAYAIVGNQVVLQANVDISAYNPGKMAVANAIWPEKELMFITYEGSGIVVWSSTKTLQKLGEFDTNISDCAGIVVDKDKELIYIIPRDTEYLYSYFFDDSHNTLVFEQTNELQSSSGYIAGWGLALDEANDILYVTDESNRVHYYDTDDWSLEGYIDITVDGTDREAVGIAVDPVRGFMYTGAFHGQEGYHEYLVGTEISSPNNSIGVLVEGDSSDEEAIGLAVDVDTGYVYVTTDDDDFRVYGSYDSNLALLHTEENNDIANPAGVAIAGGNAIYKPPFATLTFDKDEVSEDCVSPGDYITYTISYDANGTAVHGVNIVDFLPREVDVNGLSPLGVYDSLRHTITWSIGYLPPDEANVVTLSVRVNDLAEPNGTITNCFEIESDEYYSGHSGPLCADTNVCCRATDIIYVDEDRWAGIQTGVSWYAAYTDLQDALSTARHCDCNQIWVAEGTYKPTTEPPYVQATFKLVDGVPLYGGFVGTETSLDQRNWMLNDTTLTGDIDSDGDGDASYVVTASDANEATIDGFIITMGGSAGIRCDSSSATIRHNRIRKNSSGIWCQGSNSNISNCLIENNGWDGVHCLTNSSLTIRNCEIRNNGGYGVGCISISTALIENNWIHHNASEGIFFESAASEPLVRNNTVVGNTWNGGYAGITTWYTEPNVTNCIVWGNDAGSLDGTFGDVTYSCIEGNPVYTGTRNINTDPNFVNDPNDPNNYHLAHDSPCVDTGDPNFDPNDPNETNFDPNDPNATDIDGEHRTIDGDANDTRIIDMGADEYYWSPADFDKNKKVDFVDYAMFAKAWRTTPNDINDYDDMFDLADNDAIDYNDLALFCKDWLWEAGWTKSFACGMGRGMGGMALESQQMMEASYPAEPKTQPVQTEPPDPEEVLKWLEELWLTNELLRKMITEDEWLKFIEAIKEEI